ncbi:MAG: hypothetical protein K0Q87_85 [Neobacillus sp.]|jgi:hypothetical protein|nr:hypothetical protein [Neobacillus sp.]
MSLDFLNGFLDDFNKKAEGQRQQTILQRNNQYKNQNYADRQSYETRKRASLEKISLTPKMKKKKKKDESFLTDVKDFFTGKDTDGDGQRNGLLGALDRYVVPISKGATEFVAPGNNERMIQNDIAKHGKITNPVNKASLVDRGTETKALNTAGMMMAAIAPYGQAYKTADFAFNKVPKLAKLATTSPYISKAIKGAAAGGMAEGGLSAVNELVNPEAYDMKDYAFRTGIGVAGGAILDPALYGAGQAIKKGSEKHAANVMGKLLPKNEQVAKTFANTMKQDYALPVVNKNPNPMLLDDLIPSGPDITNPNYVPKLGPNTTKQVIAPKVTNPAEQQLKLTEGQLDEWKPLADEFEQAVEQQFQYLKNSMGKGVEYGSTGSGLGNFKEVNGGFRISNNPKWYQDFYKQNGRKPNNSELRELAEQQVREGFQDEVGTLPAWQPKKAQDIDNEIDDLLAMIRENPEQKEVLLPILQGLEEDKAAILNDLETAFKEIPELRKQQSNLQETLNIPKQTEKPTKNKPKGKTKTEIDEELRSLEINDAYLHSSRQKGKITNEEYHQKIQENELKREALVKENKAYTSELPDELKTTWNNETRASELGDYAMKQAYGGGFVVQKGGKTIQKFRTQEEAVRFMQQTVAKERGIDVSFDKEGVLNWKSTYNEVRKTWSIESGEYSIHKGGNKDWTVKKGDEVLGTFKNEKKAREVAQRHFDSQEKPIQEKVTEMETFKTNRQNSTQQIETPLNTNTPKPPSKPVEPPVNAPKQESVRQLERPENLPPKTGERKHYSTLANSEKASDEFVDGIKNLDRTYQKISDKEVVDFANGIINRDVEEAFQFVKNADRFDKRHTAVGARLIDVFQSNKEFERAVDLADILAKEGTKAGQGLQGFSVYNKLSVEGHLIRAQRRVTKLNQTLPAGKKVTLTPEIAEDIAVAADSIQKLTGQQEIGNSVIKLLDKAKKGNKLNDEELKVVQSFMSDAKKFVGDLDASAKPAKVKPVKDARSRDKVVDFMGKQEAEAKKRIEARRNRANSLPVDIFYDYTVIGASKIAKGAVKFADFSEQMVKELGDEIKPYMQQIYNKAVDNYNITSSKVSPKRLTQAEKIVNKAMENETLSPAAAEELMELTKRLVNATGDSKFLASMDLQVALNKLEQPTFAQMISSTHYQAMLLNPLTVMRNIIGNEVFYRVDRVSKLLAVPIDIARTSITGGKRTIVFNTGQFRWGNFMNPTKDYGKGMKLGTKAGWKGVNPLGLNTAYDIKSPAFSSLSPNLGFVKKALVSKFNPLHWTEKFLGVTMRSFDTAGYMRAYNQTLREQATLRAMNEGLKGKAMREAADQYFREADDNMIAIAEQYGKYATFQDNTALAKVLTKGKEGLNELSTNVATLGMAKTKEFGAGSFIIPFPKTPANLVMRAIEYSPAGLVRSANLFKNYVKLKNPLDLREGQVALSRAIVGTVGFSGFGYILADKGVLTSAGNSDYEVKELEKMAGKQPNSVNITAVQRFVTGGLNLDDLELKEGDTFISYDWMQPIALSISLGTGINQADRESESPTIAERAIRAGDSALNTIVNMSSLQGINRFVSGPPNETWSEKIAGSMQSAGSSFVPTILNQFRKATDNTSRNTTDPTFGEKFGNMAINKIPGYNKQLPPSYNTFGDRKELYPNNTNTIGNVFFNPSFVSKYKPSFEAKFVLDYINATGDKTAAPRYAPKTLDGIKLTGAEQSEMQRIMGEEVKKELAKASSSIGGNSTDFERIKKAMDKILTNAGKKARAAIREGRE